jgi:hypothetical protein
LGFSRTGAATFSSTLGCSGAFIQLNQTELFSSAGASNRAWAFGLGYATAGDFVLMQGTTASGGTYTPKLTISPTGAATFSSSVTARNGTSGVAFETTNAVDADFIIETVSGGTTKIGTNGNKLAINSGGGNVGIGSASITNGTLFGGGGQVNRLKVESSNYTCLEINGSTSGGSLQFTYDTNSPNSLGGFLGYNYANGAAKDFALVQRLSGGTVTVQSFSNGVYLASGGVAWIANSDERLKADLVPIENALNKVDSLRSVIGRYKTDEINIRRPFLIAQDVLKVLPEAVTINKETGNLGVSYSETIPLLVAAIKELSAKNEALIKRIETLENK